MRPLKALLAVQLSLAAWAGSAPSLQAADPSAYQSGEILVKLRSPSPGARLRPLAERASAVVPGATHERQLTEDGWHLLKLPEGLSVDQAVAAAGSRAEVEYAEPNLRYSIPLADAPRPGSARGEPQATVPLGATGVPTADRLADRMYGLERIGLTEAWKHTQGSRDVVIAVFDTGVDYRHPDLAENMWVNPDEIPGNGRDDDRNGFIDDIHGVNVVDGSGNPMDQQGHGTHVAGTIGAVTGNGVGVPGINPRVQILAVRVAREVDGVFTGDVVRGLDYLAGLRRRGVNLIACNHSWGGLWPSRALSEAFARLSATGVMNVCAAGNFRADHRGLPHFPNEYGFPGMLRVAASNERDQLATFSNFGGTSVELAAPGVGIWSTIPGARYAAWTGTSMASPHVTGALGLLFALKPDLSPEQARRLLMATVDPLPAFDRSRVLSGGRLNVGRAAQWLVEGRPLPSTVPSPGEPASIRAISRTPDGFSASGNSSDPSLSADGRWVAFVSITTNVVVGDTNRSQDVLLWDRDQGGVTTVSRRGAIQADGTSSSPALSGDGSVVAFSSVARNLVDGATNDHRKVFLSNRSTGELEWISRPEGAAPGGSADNPSISHDGRYVAFAAAGRLVADDQNEEMDVYVRDRASGALRLVSSGPDGLSRTGGSSSPVISADGALVAFLSTDPELITGAAGGIAQVVVRELATDALRLASVSATGEPANQASSRLHLSGDGRFLAFQSTAFNLVEGATGTAQKIFLRDLAAGRTEWVAPTAANGGPIVPLVLDGLSHDGRWVQFRSSSPNLPPRQAPILLRPYAWDRLVKDVVCLAWNDLGEPLNGFPESFNESAQGATDSAISGSGRYVALSTTAWNLAPGDGLLASDVFVADRGANPFDLTLASTASPTNEAGRGLIGPAILQTAVDRGPGTPAEFELGVIHRGATSASPVIRIEFGTGGANVTWPTGTVPLGNDTFRLPLLEPAGIHRIRLRATVTVRLAVGDSEPTGSFKVVDRVTAEVAGPLAPGGLELVSRSWDQGRPLLRAATRPRVSDDGRRVVFASLGDDVMASDRNGNYDTFLFDRSVNQTTALSGNRTGPTGNDWSIGAQISGDGNFAVFTSWASNLGPDGNFTGDLFVKDLTTGAIDLVNRRGNLFGNYNTETYGNGQVSTDGRYITYTSGASTLVPGDTNRAPDVFQLDRLTDTTTVITRQSDGQLWAAGGSLGVASRSGRFVAFYSESGMGPGLDTNRMGDAFLWDRESGQTVRLSSDGHGNALFGQSEPTSLSDDGRFVVLHSDAPDLPGPEDAGFRYLLLDRATGVFTPGSHWLPEPVAGWRFRSMQISPSGEWLLIGLERVVGEGESTSLETRVELVHRESRARRLIAEGIRGPAAISGGFSEVFSTLPLQVAAAYGFPGSADARYIVISGEGREGAPFVSQAYLADLGPEVSRLSLRITELARRTPDRLQLAWIPIPGQRVVVERASSVEGPFETVAGPQTEASAEIPLSPSAPLGLLRVRAVD